MNVKIAIIDAGSGNIPNVVRAFRFLGYQPEVVTHADQLKGASFGRLVLPGVGSFGAVRRGLDRGGWPQQIAAWLHEGKPFLGICVGLQILLEHGEESSEVNGLGLLSGTVKKFAARDGLAKDAKVPHMGWNNVVWKESPLSIDDGYAYFVHSYYVPVATRGVVGRTEYGGLEFASAIGIGDRGLAVQFHPEKSGPWGLELLDRFAGDTAWN